MITTFLLNFILVPIDGLFQLLPIASSLGLNTMASSVVSFIPGLGWANDYFPLTAAVSALTVIVATLAIMLLVNVGLWLYHQFWGS